MVIIMNHLRKKRSRELQALNALRTGGSTLHQVTNHLRLTLGPWASECVIHGNPCVHIIPPPVRPLKDLADFAILDLRGEGIGLSTELCPSAVSTRQSFTPPIFCCSFPIISYTYGQPSGLTALPESFGLLEVLQGKRFSEGDSE